MKSKNKRISRKAAETGVFYVKGLEQIGTTVKRGNGTAFKEGACALRTAADSDEGKETAGAGVRDDFIFYKVECMAFIL